MPNRAESVFYSDVIALRRRDGGPRRPTHLTIRHTQVYRLRSVRSASASHLEPRLGDVFLLSTLAAPVTLRVGVETAVLEPEELVVVTTPSVEIAAESPTDIVLAVSQGAVIRGMGMIREASPDITRVPINTMMAAPLNSALVHAFDLLDEGTGALDPRVVDFLHLMSRGLMQLPRDPHTTGDAGVSVVDRARALIAGTHMYRSTTPATVADALGVPLRTVQRAFAADGTSLARELRSARARTARALIDGHPSTAGTSTRTAEHSGFGSVASMRRALLELEADNVDTSGDAPPRET